MTTPLTTVRLRRYMRYGMLPRLAAFEALMRLGSATRAAEALCIAQPRCRATCASSARCSVCLFELQDKHLVPTAPARALLPVVHEVFAAFECCERVLDGLRGDAHVGPWQNERRRSDGAGVMSGNG